jgi:hypothetical protein
MIDTKKAVVDQIRNAFLLTLAAWLIIAWIHTAPTYSMEGFGITAVRYVGFAHVVKDEPVFLTVGVALGLAGLIVGGWKMGWAPRVRVMAALLAALFVVWFFIRTVELGPSQSFPSLTGGDWESSSFAYSAAQSASVALSPMLITLAAAAIAAFIDAARGAWRTAVVLAVGLALVPAATHILRDVANPLSGYEAVQDNNLSSILKFVPDKQDLIIVSDLADPADDYLRFGKGFYLSVPYGNAFFVAQTEWDAIVFEDVEARRILVDRFFLQEWGIWHESILSEREIQYVLYNTRCPPVWNAEDVAVLLDPVVRGEWTLLRVDSISDTFDSVDIDGEQIGWVVSPSREQGACR